MTKSYRLLRSLMYFFTCASILLSCSQKREVPAESTIPQDGWVIIVDSEGPHYLGSEWWKNIGVDPSSLGYEDIQLRKNGKDVPYLWINNEHGKGILFYAEVSPTRTGPLASYALNIGKPGMEMRHIPQTESPSDTVCQESSLESIIYEENNSYRSTAPVESPWFWTSLRPTDNLTFTIPLTRSVAGPITVTFKTWGQSSMPQNPDHHIRIKWNESQSEDHFWDGSGIEKWDSVFYGDGKSVNNLIIASPGETDAPVEVTWLDSVEVMWRKSLIWSSNEWERWYPDGQPEVCWTDLTGEELVGLLRNEQGIVFQAKVGNKIPQYDAVIGWIGDPQQAPGPILSRHVEYLNQEDLHNIEYLVIAPKSFHKVLDPLMERRSREGFSVLLISPEQVYDTFGQGIPEATALNSLATTLTQEGQLRYLLLVGDTSNAIDMAPEEMFQHIPTGWVKTAIVGETPSDFKLVSDENGMPVTAVGRFPASNAAEVTVMVNKTLDWEPNKRILFIGDDEAEFDRFIDNLVSVSPQSERLSARDANTRNQLLSWLRADAGLLIYSGHGSLPMLGDEKILTQEDAGNWDEATVVAAWSCLCAGFTHPSYQGLAESWMKAKKGTVAFIGPTGETTSAQQHQMAIEVQKSLVAGDRIGDALIRGWTAANSEDAKVSFILLGDPALRPYNAESE